MTPLEANAILAKAGQYDGRKPDVDTAIEWADELAGFQVHDCIEAVRDHYREGHRWVMPSDLIGRIKAVRTDRIERHKWKLRIPAHIADMEDGPEHDAAQSAWLAGAYRAIADGQIPPTPETRAIGTGYAASIKAALPPPPPKRNDDDDDTEENDHA